MTFDWRQRHLWILLSLAVLIPLVLWMGLYDGQRRVIQNSWGGVAYVVFWCLVAFLAFPRRKAITPIAAAVLAVTAGLEVLQMWHPDGLERVRSHPLGAALIGTYFEPTDFLYYVIGAAMGWFVMYALSTTGEEEPKPKKRPTRPPPALR